jgi:hypothetical protein
MPNTTLSEAIKEAYATAPTDVVMLHTIELRHPSFSFVADKERGAGTAVRIVRDTQNLWATLETDSSDTYAYFDSGTDKLVAAAAASSQVVGYAGNSDGYYSESAAVNAGQKVLFVGLPFDFTLPITKDRQLPQLRLKIDNVGREICQHIEAAIENPESIAMTYRVFLSSNIDGIKGTTGEAYEAGGTGTPLPEMDPQITMTLSNVKVDPFKIEATATYDDVLQRLFPAEMYTTKRFPYLDTTS